MTLIKYHLQTAALYTVQHTNVCEAGKQVLYVLKVLACTNKTENSKAIIYTPCPWVDEGRISSSTSLNHNMEEFQNSIWCVKHVWFKLKGELARIQHPKFNTRGVQLQLDWLEHVFSGKINSFFSFCLLPLERRRICCLVLKWRNCSPWRCTRLLFNAKDLCALTCDISKLWGC